LAIAAMLVISSCSFLNDKEVSVPITSNPPGADLYINGKYYGQTPKIVKLDPSKDKQYTATVSKRGYGRSNLDLESWYSVRGGRGGDTFRCVMDALGTMLVIPAFGFYSTHCRDFKLKRYVIDMQSDGSVPFSDNYRGGYQNNNPQNPYQNQQNYPSGGYNGSPYQNGGDLNDNSYGGGYNNGYGGQYNNQYNNNNYYKNRR
ncbi:MAG: PEGA domain-containing protein, partial [Proteobacteria bacterium]|nr:PEGA domain-containing protein [Pseudomonadota bacterium]